MIDACSRMTSVWNCLCSGLSLQPSPTRYHKYARWGDSVVELWASALSSAGWIRLVKCGVEPTDLFWQVQPDRAAVCLNPLALLPGQAVSRQPGLGHVDGGGQEAGHAVPKTACSADWSFCTAQTKLINPWPQVFKTNDSTGASGAKRKCQSSESVTPKLQTRFKNVLPAICLQSYGKSVAGWKYNVDIHLPALWFHNRTVLPRYSSTSIFSLYQKHSLCMCTFFTPTSALQGWISASLHIIRRAF